MLTCHSFKIFISISISPSLTLYQIFYSFSLKKSIRFVSSTRWQISLPFNNKIKLCDWEGATSSFFAIANDNYTLTTFFILINTYHFSTPPLPLLQLFLISPNLPIDIFSPKLRINDILL